ncbi:hypothetical protein F0562_007188 [Nyssa sinensis]|uniref:NB-ARC domain-containing protein n=1 Tax=Nyssa sinensis TaxID=561372 RepID=A0A5J5A366_9ASTE|nr:hypothetical protein F0562_007188 [Nyssa sinensis]
MWITGDQVTAGVCHKEEALWRGTETKIDEVLAGAGGRAGGDGKLGGWGFVAVQGLTGSTSTPVVNKPCYDHRRHDALLLEEAEVVGMDRPKKQLIKWLVEDNPRFKVISVEGIGGLGKTTLVKKVYEDVQVKRHFQNHAWITVSQLFKIKELLKNLIQQLFDEIKQPLPQRVEAMDITELTIQIKQFLQQSRYVIALDDVWSIDAWHSIKLALPDNNCGSRVLLTTRIVDIASTTSTVDSHGHFHHMEALAGEESWTLFCRKTFQDNCCPDH